MNSDAVLATGLDTFAATLDQVPAGAWDDPTPCDGWTVRHLVGHVLQVTDATVVVLGGGEYDWSSAGPPEERAAGDAASAFADNAAAVRTALDAADLEAVKETPMGPMRVGDRISFMAMDLHLHSWDLGHAIGAEPRIPEPVIDFCHSVMDPLPDAMVRSAGVFGPALEPPAGATPTQQLVAWAGRRP